MLNPVQWLTMFKLRTKQANAREQYATNHFGSDGFAPTLTYLEWIVDHAITTGIEHYWSFAQYERKHTKSDIKLMTGIMLSFPYAARSELLEFAKSYEHVCYLIHSQAEINTKRPEEKWTFVVPLEEPITSTDDYTRIAALISDQIGIKGHTPGDFAATFLFAPFTQICSEPTFRLYDQDRSFLNAEAFIAENKGVWINAKSMQEGAEFQHQPRQIDPTGLFQFPV